MKRRLSIKRGAAVAAVAGILSFGLLSWDFKHYGQTFTANDISDTLPPGKEKKIRNLDDVLIELDEAQLKMDKEFKLDMEKMKKEIEESMKKIDMDKIKLEIERSLKEADFEKIRKEIENSMTKVDWDKMKADLDKIKEIDLGKMELDMKKMEEEMKKMGPEIEKSMEKAKVEIEKAKAEMKEYKTFVDGLEKAGLIDKNKEYTIKHKDGELFINGKKQTADVYNQYRSFLDKHKAFTIEKSDDDFHIDID